MVDCEHAHYRGASEMSEQLSTARALVISESFRQHRQAFYDATLRRISSDPLAQSGLRSLRLLETFQLSDFGGLKR